MEGHKRLPEKIIDKITDPQNKVLVSVATVWEIAIKSSLNQIRISFDIEKSIVKAGFEVLVIEVSHALGIEKLPIYHKDPFDRILVSQAQAEGLTLVTSDQKIWKYDINILKC